MILPATIAVATAAQHGGVSLMTWVLWGGLAVAFCALYIGVYVWMRRPKFGEGGAQDSDAQAVDPTRQPEPSVGSHREDPATESSQGLGPAPTPGP